MRYKNHMNAREYQRGVSKTVQSSNPSKVESCYWIYATAISGHEPSIDAGKWLVFVHIDEVDVVWRRIKAATEAGKLGSLSKVSTAKANKNAYDPDTKVICVYCQDSNDEKDVMRVRDELRRLGIEDRIPYKTDQATREGRYKNRGSKNVSKYFV